MGCLYLFLISTSVDILLALLRIGCGAGSMKRFDVRPSVHMSVPAWVTAGNFAAVTGPAEDIDRLLHGAQLQRGVRRAVPRCQRT